MRLWIALFLLVWAPWVSAEKGRLPPPPEADYNSMVLDYIVTGGIFQQPTFSDDWTRSYKYVGKLDPSFGGVLRVTGRAQWLTYPGPGKGYPWTVSVMVRAGDKVKSLSYSPESTSQSFDLSVPIGNADEGEFSLSMSRSSSAGSRNMSASGTLRGRVTYGPGNPETHSVTGKMPHEQVARDPSTMRPVEPGPTPKGMSPEACLAKLLSLYAKAILPGICSSGMHNNTLSLLGFKRFDDYVCGAYQSKVLSWLDGLRFSSDPKVRALLDAYDYGPVQAYYGGHQAVVIYPKGTNWVDSGLVLDPWPTQSPKSYAVAEWAQRFSQGSYHGIGGSDLYSGPKAEYPTVGGTYVDPKNKTLTKAEQTWAQGLPPEVREKFRRMQSESNRRGWIKRNFAERNLDTQVLVQCPVEPVLKDAQGRISGFSAGQAMTQVPGVEILRVSDERGGWWSQLRFPQKALSGGPRPLVLRGTASGRCRVFVAYGAGPTSQKPWVEAFEVDLSSGQEAVLEAMAPGAGLVVNGVRVEPVRPSVQAGQYQVTIPTPKPMSVPTFDLSGTWRTRLGTYEIHQNGNRIRWVGKSADGGQSWTHDFEGQIQGRSITGFFKDRPPGQVLSQGRLEIRIVNKNRLEMVTPEGGFGDTEWTR
jgi:hypothetical protein